MLLMEADQTILPQNHRPLIGRVRVLLHLSDRHCSQNFQKICFFEGGRDLLGSCPSGTMEVRGRSCRQRDTRFLTPDTWK